MQRWMYFKVFVHCLMVKLEHGYKNFAYKHKLQYVSLIKVCDILFQQK